MKRISDALGSVSDKVFHFEAEPGTSAPYIVWAEEIQGDTVWADDRQERASLQGSIDLYTKDAHEPLKGKVERALNTGEISWYLNSVQYEEETGLLHYEWVWEVD